MRERVQTLVVLAVLVVFGGVYVGLWSFKVIGYERIGGQPTFNLPSVVGAETGVVCPVDKRYFDEDPKGLRDDVLTAWTGVKAKAKAAGVTLCLHDGKRSSNQQQAQFDDYVRKYGTVELARKYVLPPADSMHVQGNAVDVQPLASAAWLERTAGSEGWCRRYDNEPWHFEYDPAYQRGCPARQPHA